MEALYTCRFVLYCNLRCDNAYSVTALMSIKAKEEKLKAPKKRANVPDPLLPVALEVTT